MKTLKFMPELCEMILAGDKTVTWRLFDDKDLQEGDALIFINKQTGQVFGNAEIINLKTRTLGTLTKNDWIGHEKFPSETVMYDTYKNYYGDIVNPDTEVKIITFDFKPN